MTSYVTRILGVCSVLCDALSNFKSISQTQSWHYSSHLTWEEADPRGE